ncbi:hypothetical protein QG039_09005, partial [Kingella kingae]|nr:hypothetical protein [Kingella kingae]
CTRRSLSPCPNLNLIHYNAAKTAIIWVNLAVTAAKSPRRCRLALHRRLRRTIRSYGETAQ